jgi:hypothetical protein
MASVVCKSATYDDNGKPDVEQLLPSARRLPRGVIIAGIGATALIISVCCGLLVLLLTPQVADVSVAKGLHLEVHEHIAQEVCGVRTALHLVVAVAAAASSRVARDVLRR